MKGKHCSSIYENQARHPFTQIKNPQEPFRLLGVFSPHHLMFGKENRPSGRPSSPRNLKAIGRGARATIRLTPA